MAPAVKGSIAASKVTARGNSAAVASAHAEVVDDDDLLDAGQPCCDLGDLGGNVKRLAVVPVAVADHEHARLDLAETVEDALDAEVRRAGRPDCAQRVGGAEGHDGLGHVGRDGADTVTGFKAELLQRLVEPRHGAGQFRPGDGAFDLVFATEDDGRRAVAAAKQVFGEVQNGIGEISRARHCVFVHHQPVTAGFSDDTAEVPDIGPEPGRV
jgi:hypothetical protein